MRHGAVFVHVPPGVTYAIAAVDQSGFASLAVGASAVLRTRLFFQGQPVPAFVDHSLPGGFSDFWSFTDTVDPAAIVFAPCDSSQPHLNIENIDEEISFGITHMNMH